MPRLNDIGVALELEVLESGSAKDISTASTKQIKLEAPGGNVATQTAAFSDDGTDGKIRFVTTSADDLNELGTWTYQAKLIISSQTFHTDTATFEVKKVLS